MTRHLCIVLTQLLYRATAIIADQRLWRFPPNTGTPIPNYFSGNAICFDLVPLQHWFKIPQPIVSSHSEKMQPERPHTLAGVQCLDLDYLGYPLAEIPKNEVLRAGTFYMTCPSLLDPNTGRFWGKKPEWELKRIKVSSYSPSERFQRDEKSLTILTVQALCTNKRTLVYKMIQGDSRQCLELSYNSFKQYVFLGRPYRIVAFLYNEVPPKAPIEYLDFLHLLEPEKNRVIPDAPWVPFLDIFPITKNVYERMARNYRGIAVPGLALPYERVVRGVNYMACTSAPGRRYIFHLAVELLGGDPLPSEEQQTQANSGLISPDRETEL